MTCPVVLTGVCQMLLLDAVSMEQFILACASWDQVPNNTDVAVGIRNILLAVRVNGVDEAAASQGVLGQSWSRLMNRMDESTVTRIHQVFELST